MNSDLRVTHRITRLAWLLIFAIVLVACGPAGPTGPPGPAGSAGGLGLNVKTFGARGDGVSDDTGAIQSVIDSAQARGGGIVFFPVGAYLISRELKIYNRYKYVRLVGESKAVFLRAVAPNISLIHYSGSQGSVENLSFESDSVGVTALEISPEDSDDEVSWQQFNKFADLRIAGCKEGISMRTGPYMANGGASGVWYNTFQTINITYTERGVWLREPPAGQGGSSSAVNRNQFFAVQVGNFVNCGVWIDSGADNVFTACSFEGVNGQLMRGPSHPPTAIVIKDASPKGGANSGNIFVSNKFEANDIDLANYNPRSEFYGSTVRFGLNRFMGNYPRYVFGGDPSITPTVFPGGPCPDLPGLPTYYDNCLANFYLVPGGALEVYVETIEDPPGFGAHHTRPGEWGLCALNLADFLPATEYKVTVRYKLTGGASLGLWDRNRQENRVLGELPESSGAFSEFTVRDAAGSIVTFPISQGDLKDTYFYPDAQSVLDVSWILFETVPGCPASSLHCSAPPRRP